MLGVCMKPVGLSYLPVHGHTLLQDTEPDA